MAGPSVMYATQTTLVFVVAIILMVSIDPWLTMVALLPLPFVSVSVKVFGTGHPSAVRAHPGTAFRAQCRGAGEPVGRAGRARVRPGARGAGEVPRGQRGVHRAQSRADSAAGGVLPEPDAAARPGRAARALAGEPRGDCRPHHRGRAGRVQCVPGDAGVADDRLWLGHQHAAARHRVVEAHARDARRAAGHRGSASARGVGPAARSPDDSNCAT